MIVRPTNQPPRLALTAADVLLVVGERLGEMVTGGYTLLAAPQPKQALIHVHPGAEELGRVYQPALALQASVAPACAALAAMAPIGAPAWSGSAAAAHAEYLAWSESPKILASLIAALDKADTKEAVRLAREFQIEKVQAGKAAAKLIAAANLDPTLVPMVVAGFAEADEIPANAIPFFLKCFEVGLNSLARNATMRRR